MVLKDICKNQDDMTDTETTEIARFIFVFTQKHTSMAYEKKIELLNKFIINVNINQEYFLFYSFLQLLC